MAYANAQSPNRRAAILGTVAAIHVLAGYALVTGLASRFIPEVITTFTGGNIPAPKPTPTPEPRPPRAEPSAQRDPRVIDPPFPQPLPPLPQGPVELTGSSGGTGGDFGTGEIPLDLPPLPQPTFTPRGPKPRGSEANWVSANDYPSNDLRQDHEGLTRVRLGVGTNGKVTRCEITASSGWPGLDKAACDKLSSRARFDPATDRTGEEVEGSYSTAVRWRIPEE